MSKKLNKFTKPFGYNRFVYLLSNIKQRCNNPKHPSFKNYGGRGIYCYLTSFQLQKLWFRDNAFEMKRPSIDRKDNNGHYVYSNCRFIEQSANSKKAFRERFDDREVLNRKIINYQI